MKIYGFRLSWGQLFLCAEERREKRDEGEFYVCESILMVKGKEMPEDLWYFCLTVGKYGEKFFGATSFVRSFVLSVGTNGFFWNCCVTFKSHKVSFGFLDGSFILSKAVTFTHIAIINPSADPKWHLLNLMLNLIFEIFKRLSVRWKNPYQTLLLASWTI